MNIKKFLIYIAILLLPLNVFAVEIQDKSKLDNYHQSPSVMTLAFDQGISGNTLFTPNTFDSPTMIEPLVDSSSEFLTAMIVYLLIIVVYSLYWIRFSSKNYR